MDQEKAFQLWESLYGDLETAYDYASHLMRKSDFGNEDSIVGWTIDYKKPLTQGGTYVLQNQIPCAYSTFRLREGKNAFAVGSHHFEVRKGKIYGTFEIFDITDRNHPLNLDPAEFDQDPEFNKARKKDISSVYAENFRSGLPSIDSLYQKALRDELDQIDFKSEEKTEETEAETAEAVEEEMGSAPAAAEPIIETVTPIEEKKEEVPPVETERFPAENKTIEGKPIPVNSENKEEIAKEVEIPSETTNTSEVEALKEELAKRDEEICRLNDRLLEMDEKIAASERQGTMKDDYLRVDETTEPDDSPKDNLQEQITLLTDELEKEKAKNQELEKETENLLIDFNNAQQRAETFSNQAEQYQQLRAKLEEKDGEILSLRDQLATSRTELEEMHISISSFAERESRETEGHKAEIASLQQELSSLRSKQEEQEAQQKELQAQIEAKNQESLTKEAQIQSLQEQISALNQSQKTKEEEVSATEGQLRQSLSEQEKRQEEMKFLLQEKENALSSLNAELMDLDTSKQSLDATLITLRQNLETKDQEMSSLRLKVEEQEKALAMKEGTLQNLRKEAEETQTAFDALQKEKEELSSAMQLSNDESKKERENITSLQRTIQSARDENEHLRAEKNELQNRFDELQAEYAKQEETRQHVEASYLSLDAKAKELESSLTEKIQAFDTLSEQSEKDQIRANEQIEELNAQLNLSEKKEMILREGGRAKNLEDVLAYLEETHSDYTPESIRLALQSNASWLSFDEMKIGEVPSPTQVSVEEVLPFVPTVLNTSEEDVASVEEERGRRKKAEEYFQELYGEENNLVSDFAGRFFRKADFRNQKSRYGWDYALLDSREPEGNNNIVIANLRTLSDYRNDQSFNSNGHAYQVVKEGERTFLHSIDYITDPFDYEQALKVTAFNESKKSPIIYIFVKAMSVAGGEAQKESVLRFFDLIDRTVKRCCPESFIEMKTKLGAKTDYAFITFDGSVDGAYKETMDYALILNAYRQQFCKEGQLNAILVINEIEIPFSMRHLTLDRLINETGNQELMALRYELLMTSVINSLISKTIHIGPSILDKVPIHKEALKDSRLAQGNFASAYGFQKMFKVYNFGYTLKHKADQQTE